MLIPFCFNKLSDTDDPKAHLASQGREKKFNIKSDELTPPDAFCPLCYSPLSNPAHSDSTEFTSEHQIADILEEFYSLLPQPIISRATYSSSSEGDRFLREKIQDFLLSDSEDDA